MVGLLSFENLYRAYRKACRGTKSYEAYRFRFNVERELFDLQDELCSEAYSPGKYRYFSIADPKPRTIAVAPFRDRIVHHALVNVLVPVFEPRFIFDSYATRKGKGTHAAISRAQRQIPFPRPRSSAGAPRQSRCGARRQRYRAEERLASRLR